MENTSAVTLILLLAMVSAIPYVAWIRHPSQKPLAAYLIFAVVFLAAFLVLFNGLIYLLRIWGFGELLEQTPPLVLLLLFAVAVSLALATRQAKKPHIARKPR